MTRELEAKIETLRANKEWHEKTIRGLEDDIKAIDNAIAELQKQMEQSKMSMYIDYITPRDVMATYKTSNIEQSKEIATALENLLALRDKECKVYLDNYLGYSKPYEVHVEYKFTDKLQAQDFSNKLALVLGGNRK
jgi:alanyl-tRNA synthetase